jgi:hypothetical protein
VRLQVVAHGCTVSDLVQQCGTVRNHGIDVSCASGLLRGLVVNGVISQSTLDACKPAYLRTKARAAKRTHLPSVGAFVRLSMKDQSVPVSYWYGLDNLLGWHNVLMKCLHCGHHNHPDGRFCEQCATPLHRDCCNCGGALPAGAKFLPCMRAPHADYAIRPPYLRVSIPYR